MSYEAPSLASQIALAREAIAQDEEHARNAVREPVYRLSTESLRKSHAELHERIEQADKRKERRIRTLVSTCATKHFANKGLDELEVVSQLRDLTFPGANGGKALVLQLAVGATARTTALQLLAKDADDWHVPVYLYYTSSNFEKQLKAETLICIREPYIKENKAGYFLKVESPADLLLWPTIPSSIRTQFSSPKLDLEGFRQAGSQAFASKDYYGSLYYYEGGIFHYPEDPSVSLLRLNAALAYLNTGRPGKAYRHLDVCNSSLFTGPQKQKWEYRKSLALYQLYQYELALKSLKSQVKAYPDVEQFSLLLERTKARIEEQRSGNINFLGLFQAAAEGREVDVADYQGPVKVTNKAGRGRALVATRRIRKGELLIVAKPLSLALEDRSRLNIVMGMNLATAGADPYARTDLIGQIIERAADRPSWTKQFEGLFVGSRFADPSKPDFSNSAEEKALKKGKAVIASVDAGRIEGICTYNSFTPQCITQLLAPARETEEDGLHAQSALYGLPSMMNHACIGNAAYVFFGGAFVLRALTDISLGAEIVDSYFNAASPYPDRQAQARQYGFECTCPLCLADAADGKALYDRIKLSTEELPLLQSAKDLSASRAQAYIDSLEATYRFDRKAPKPELYAAYRLLSNAYDVQKDESPALVFAAEIKGLEALGAKFKINVPKGTPASATFMPHTFVEDPVLMLQDSIISCLKIAYTCFLGESIEQAKAWFVEAKRLHDKTFGPALFHPRMREFAETQVGWTVLWQLAQFGSERDAGYLR